MIDFDFIGLGEYSVETDTERVFFYSLHDAEEFINEKGADDNAIL